MNQDIQQSELIFYLPLVASYVVACFLAYVIFKKNKVWGIPSVFEPQKPWQELVFAFIAVLCIFILGRIYDAGFLVSSRYNSIAWIINNLIIYSPIFILVTLRKQPMVTLWISRKNLVLKVVTGFFCAFLGVFVFIALRGEIDRIGPILLKSISLDSIASFVAVFMEGVVVAFIFIRLKWVSNLKVALFVPGLLFALGHVPGMLAQSEPWWHIILMSIFTGFIAMFVLYTCNNIKDIVWLGIVHYFMDVAINAF
ncbi:MAG: hypothetical protein AAGC43_14975 [Bacteroidota bacterium]